jgi:hypothetical protein
MRVAQLIRELREALDDAIAANCRWHPDGSFPAPDGHGHTGLYGPQEPIRRMARSSGPIRAHIAGMGAFNSHIAIFLALLVAVQST